MNELINFIRGFGIARLGVIVGVSFGVAIALALIIVRVGAPSMSILYADIPYADAQSIASRLEQTGTRFELKDNGANATILVPRNNIADAHLDLAAEGLAVRHGFGGGIGYEIFDENQTLGATTFQQTISRLRALEGELARTITGLNGVRSARVHLVLPERELFSRDRQTASASIIVEAPGGIGDRAVRAIVNLVASAVPSLDVSRITVTDQTGALLASGSESGEDMMALSVEDQKIATEARIRRNVEDIVSRIVGADNVRVNIASEMDFSRVTESAEIVDPDSQIALSSTTVEEISNSSDPAAQSVSVANALPGSADLSDDGPASTSTQQRTEETTNYEISKTVRSAVREEGFVIKKLSVAVAINGAAANLADGELGLIEELVKSAIGFNAARGDQISVIDIPFTDEIPVETALPGTQSTGGTISNAPLASNIDITRIAEVGALAAIAFSLAFFVLRPMLAQSATKKSSAETSVPMQQAIEPQAAEIAAAALEHQPDSALEKRIDLAQVDGQVKASSVNKVSEIVKSNTDESVMILRNWMREAS